MRFFAATLIFACCAPHQSGTIATSILPSKQNPSDTPAPPTISDFVASADSIVSGASLTLSWTVDSGAVVLSNSSDGTTQSFGAGAQAVAVSPAATTMYTLTATGEGGDTKASLTITVSDADSVSNPAAPVITTFTADGSGLTAGQAVHLSWVVRDASTLVISNSLDTTTLTTSDASGTSAALTPAATVTYTLTASSAGGTVSATVTVTVGAPAVPIISSFTASKMTITQGAAVTLSYAASNTTSVSIANTLTGTVITAPNATGTTAALMPAATVTYTLTATGPGGSATRTVKVTVNPPAASIVSFGSSAPAINVGQTITLAWSVQNATSIAISNSLSSAVITATTATGTTAAQSPATSVTYTLTATGPGGVASKTVTVTVNAGSCAGTGSGQASGTLTTTDGVVHTYYYHFSGTAAPAAGHPVIMWLHGDGGSGKGYATQFYPYTDPDAAIVVTPTGINQTWTHAADDLAGQPQDAQFLSALIDHMIASGLGCATIDPKRIYLGGESRGAFMPYFMLQRPSTKGKLAAVAVNAGLLYCQKGDSDCDADQSSAAHHGANVPILHLHGTDDTSVAPPPTATWHKPTDWGVDWRVFWPMNFWAQQNGCWAADTEGGVNDGVLKESFFVGSNAALRYDLTGNGSKCTRYSLILVTNGGHVIGGQQQRIWSFLKQYTLGN